MKKTLLTASALGLFLAGGLNAALAAPDWGKVPSRKVTLLYPGASGMEWITKGLAHSGAKGLKKGETCNGCHEEEVVEIGRKIAAGEKSKDVALEPSPVKGRAGSIPVTMQAAYDANNLYLRFQWKAPASAGTQKMDKDNAVKLGVMLEDNKVEMGSVGCWATCHTDARTMPGVKDDMKTKYIKDANLAGGKFYDLIQFRSGKGQKPVDGHVADKRVMEGGKGLVDAKGELKGDTWTVTMTRKLAGGGVGDIVMQPGKAYNFGFAIHDDHAIGRYHYVSLGYTLGLDAKADIAAVKQ